MLLLNYSHNSETIAELIRLSVVYCNYKETVAKPKRYNSCLTLKSLFWMILRHKERSPEGLLVDEILDGVGGLKSWGCTEVWQGWNMLTLFNPVPKCHSHPSLVWSLGKLSTGICFLFGSRGAHDAAILVLPLSIYSLIQSVTFQSPGRVPPRGQEFKRWPCGLWKPLGADVLTPFIVCVALGSCILALWILSCYL